MVLKVGMKPSLTKTKSAGFLRETDRFLQTFNVLCPLDKLFGHTIKEDRRPVNCIRVLPFVKTMNKHG